ncbi:MAG: anti-sigma regulatory factor [Anaerolineales bacterium]|nr:anti-sigma regulatory factor [Anaerolineales bacterium]
MDALTLPGTLDSLKALRDYVTQASRLGGLGKKAAYRLNLAVDEIATNIVLHGYQEANLQGDLCVSAEINAQTLTVRLEDTGIDYDPSLTGVLENPDQPLDQRKEGGLGVYLAVRNVDHFTYERVGERNIHILVVQLNKESEG